MSKSVKKVLPKSSIKLNVEVVVFKEEEQWIAYCPSLELSSYGDDADDAKAAFEDALLIFLEETDRKGTLERYLLKMGWELRRKPKPIYTQPVFSLNSNKRLLKKNPTIFTEKVAIPLA